MHTHIHALTYAGVHISTLHMCIHFASIAQMVKFKPVGLLKWWRHYKECSNSVSAIYMKTSCTRPTLYKYCNGAHFKWQSHCCHFNQNVSTLANFIKYISHKNVLFASQIHTPLIWEAKQQAPLPYAVFSTNHKYWNTKTFKRLSLPFPCTSLFVDIKADFMRRNSHRLMESCVGERKGWQSIWTNHKLRLWLWIMLCFSDCS